MPTPDFSDTPWTRSVTTRGSRTCLMAPREYVTALPATARDLLAPHLPASDDHLTLRVVLDALAATTGAGQPALRDLANGLSAHVHGQCSCESLAAAEIADALADHLAQLGQGPWIVLGPDGDVLAEPDTAPTTADLLAFAGTEDLWFAATAAWDGTGNLTVTFSSAHREVTLTAHLLTGQRAIAAEILTAGQDGYGIDNPHTLALRHAPDLVLFATGLFDDSADFAENVGYLDYLIETLEESWPLPEPQRRVLADLAGEWTGSVEELVMAAAAIDAEPVPAA